jgi:hypothetical protein
MTYRDSKQSKSDRAQTSTGLQIQIKTMKTKSLTSIATLLGVVVLNASAFAGPDPQLVPSLLRSAPSQKSVSHEKKVTIALTGHSKALKAAQPAKNTNSTVFVVPGPHGDNRIYRR